MSDVRWVDELLGGWRYRSEVHGVVTDAFEWEAPEEERRGFLQRWRDRFVESMGARLQREADRELGLLGDAKRGVMVSAGWVDEVHELPPVVYPRRAGKSSVFEEGVLGSWAGLPFRVMSEEAIGRAVALEDAIARVEATFAAQQEEVLTQATVAVLRSRGWVVAEPGHMHVWESATPHDVVRNQWSCRCGAVKYDEGMPG